MGSSIKLMDSTIKLENITGAFRQDDKALHQMTEAKFQSMNSTLNQITSDLQSEVITQQGVLPDNRLGPLALAASNMILTGNLYRIIDNGVKTGKYGNSITSRMKQQQLDEMFLTTEDYDNRYEPTGLSL